MAHYELCLCWNWEFDRDFAQLLDAACRAGQIRLLQATPDNLPGVLARQRRGEFTVGALLDRASPADPLFRPLVERFRAQGVFEINPPSSAWTQDKAAMHLALLEAGLRTPYTILLPPYATQPELPALDLTPLGTRFAIKPAHGGGGEGVIVGAEQVTQALMARQEYPHDAYLLQAQVEPLTLEGRPAWFRCLHCTGETYPCWWDPKTHIYLPVSAEQETALGLSPLREITARLARLSGLHLFSTEIALSAAEGFCLVDYINDQIDLRLQSRAADGVPDAIVREIAARLAGLAASAV